MTEPTGVFHGPLESWPTQDMEREARAHSLARGLKLVEALESGKDYPNEDDPVASGISLKGLVEAVNVRKHI